jgi:hypothetical protein
MQVNGQLDGIHAMTNPKDLSRSIRALAVRIGGLQPKADEHIASVGFMAGALYALECAAELGYDDSRSNPEPANMATEFSSVLTAIGQGAATTLPWQAGFYFNSALMRLAALNDRLAGSNDVAGNVRRSVNLLKHQPDAHISGKRPITFAEAVSAAESLCAVIEADVR